MTKAQEKKLKCEDCGKEYANASSLKRHRKKCSPVGTGTQAMMPTSTPVIDPPTIEAKVVPQCAQDLLTQAVAKGADVDTLERLMALRKEMLAEEAKAAFNKAMAQFQAECPVIDKTKEVKTDKGITAYKYAPIEKIISQLKTLIQKHGFRYSTTMECKADTVKVYCRVVHQQGHEEISEMEVPLGKQTRVMSQSQVVAAASTFAKRYAFLNAFGIMTGDEDNDDSAGRKDSPVYEPPPALQATPVQKQKAKEDPATLPHTRFMEDLNDAKTMGMAVDIYEATKVKRKQVWRKDELNGINVCFINAVARTRGCMSRGDIEESDEVKFVDNDGETIVGYARKNEKGFVTLCKGEDSEEEEPSEKPKKKKDEKADEEWKKLNRKIHAIIKEKDIKDDDYRGILTRDFDAKSCTELDNEQMKALTKTLKESF